MSCTSVETRPAMIILTSIAAAALAVVGAGDSDLLVTYWCSKYFGFLKFSNIFMGFLLVYFLFLLHHDKIEIYDPPPRVLEKQYSNDFKI